MGDLVIYITKLGRYGSNPHWKLIGILEVIDLVCNHEQALHYYTKIGLPVSQNIMCGATSPVPLDHTHGISGYNISNADAHFVIKKWDAGYNYRALKYPAVAISQVWKDVIHLDNPPIINHGMMRSIFGRIPGTQNPPQLTEAEWQNFQNTMNL